MNTASGLETDPARTQAGNGQYLSFLLGDEEYGLDILCVQEIRGWTGATPLPNAPTYVRGVVNLRGEVVPVIDLRDRFELEAQEYGRTTVVIVVHTGEAKRRRTVGLVVDAVADVYRVSPEDRSPAPDFGSGAQARFSRELAKVGDKLMIVLDIERVLGWETESEDRGPASGPPAAEGE